MSYHANLGPPLDPIILDDIVALLTALANPPKPRLDDSPYSRFVEGPRRAGIDPVWRAITRSTLLPPSTAAGEAA